MRLLTSSGFWPLYRFDPRRTEQGKLSLALDSPPPSGELEEALMKEQRFRRFYTQQPEVARQLWHDASEDLRRRYQILARMAGKEEQTASQP